MSMRKRTFAAVAILGMAFTAGIGVSNALAQDDSSACINCHTDLEEMDRYGAAAASGGAAIAG